MLKKNLPRQTLFPISA